MAEVVPIPTPIAVKRKPKRSAKKITIFGNKFYLKILRASRFKKPFTLMGLLDWDTDIDHLAGLRPNQRKVVNDFIKVGHATEKLNLQDRMAIVKAVMRGKGKYGGEVKPYPYPRLSESELKAKIEEVKRLIGR